MTLKRKILLSISSIAALFTIVVVVLYFWTINHASTLLTKLVNDQSKGTLAFTVKKVDFNLFRLKIVFTEPDLKTKDSLDQVTAYHVKAKNITVKVESAFAFIFNNELIVDSVIVNSPEVDITKYKQHPTEKISLPLEFSKVYQSLELALQKVTLNYLHFDSTKFSIYDYSRPHVDPIRVSNFNLTVNLASSKQKYGGENRFLFADRIMVEVFNQDFQFQEGLQGIKFKRLRLSTESKTLKLDSCYLYGRKADSAYGALDIYFDSIGVSNIDFNSLIKNNVLKFDSALCIRPQIKLQVAIKEKKGASGLMQKVTVNRDSLDVLFKQLLGNIDIGYLTVVNANLQIDSKKDNKTSYYSAEKIDFDIKNLVIINDPAIPVQLGNLELAIRNYTAYKVDSLSTVKFDSIKLINNKITLTNFSLNTPRDNRQINNSTIKATSFELTDINWPNFIYEQRLIAGNIFLINPEVNLILPVKNSIKPNARRNNTSLIIDDIKNKLELKNFFIVNGAVNIKMASGASVKVDNCFANVKVTQFLRADSLTNFIDAVENLSFSEALFINNNLKLHAKQGNYSGAQRALKFKEVKQTKPDNSIAVNFKNLQLDGIDVIDDNDFNVSNLSWGDADIIINNKPAGESKSISDTIAKHKFIISHTSGGPTTIRFNTPDIIASTKIDKLSVDKIVIQGGEKPIIAGLKIDGHPIMVKQKEAEGGVDVFNISDKNTSVLNNVTLRLPAGERTVRIFLPKLIFSADINKSINGLITADFIEFNKPVISFESTNKVISEDKPEAVKGKIPLMQIGTLQINEPSFANLPDNLANKMQMKLGTSEFTLRGISSDGEAIRVDSVLATIKKPNFNNNKISIIPTDKEFIGLSAIDFTCSPWADTTSEKWSFTLNSLRSSHLLIHTKSGDTVKQIIAIKSLNLDKLTFDSRRLRNYKDLLKNNRMFLLSKADLVIDNGKTIMEVNNLQIDRRQNKLSLDGFSFSPAMDKDNFIKTKTYQTPPYITFKSDNIVVNGVNFEKLIDDTAFAAKKINLSGGYLYVYKDKRLPFEHGIEKPMLTDLIGTIKLKLNIDSLQLGNSHIEYEEMNDKTLRLGKVTITEMGGNVTNIKNFNYSTTDSLRFTVLSRIMDSAITKVKYAQSYTDSLSTFHMQVNIRPFNLTALNPMLEPLVSARVKSGFLDTISMSAVGRRRVAVGKMKMYYRDLDFQYLDKGSEIKKTFKTKLITFLGNLIVHKRNRRGTGDIYTERNIEQGFPNYWIRIILSGALTNTGIRTNKKQEKKYKQGIKKFDVPPISGLSID
jgi:hypothetical protein